MSLSELYNIKKTIAKDKGFGPPSFIPTQAGVTKKCGFCHINQSNYICPNCNAPYCSLRCFQSELHKACSSPFAAKSARENADPEQIVADDEERKRMMDILKRLEESGMGGELGKDDEEDDDDEGEEMELPDLDNASTEQLLSYLSPSDRARFENALKHPDRAQALVEHLFGKSNSSDTTVPSDAPEREVEEADEEMRPETPSLKTFQSSVEPWWTDNTSNRSNRKSQDTHWDSFLGALLPLLQPQSRPSPAAAGSPAPKRLNLAYNIIALLLSYAYILRHLGLERLSDLLPPEEASTTSEESIKQRSEEEEAPQAEDDEMPPLEPDLDISDTPQLTTASHYRSERTDTLDRNIASSSSAGRAHQEAEAERTEQMSIALGMFSSLSPFLSPLQTSKAKSASHFPAQPRSSSQSSLETEDFSKVLLTSTQDASLFFLARLNSDSSQRSKGGIPNAAELLSFLLKDVKSLMEEKKVFDLSQHPKQTSKFDDLPKETLDNFRSRETTLQALADIFTLYSQESTSTKKRPNPIQAKILFYAKFLLSLGGGTIPTIEDQRTWKNQLSKSNTNLSLKEVEERSKRGEYQQILKGKGGIEKELERLENEIERDEDEKRWKATERATEVNGRSNKISVV